MRVSLAVATAKDPAPAGNPAIPAFEHGSPIRRFEGFSQDVAAWVFFHERVGGEAA